MHSDAPGPRLSPPVDTTRDHISGPVEAPATLVEFGDYECPYCGRAHRGIIRLRDERLPGQLRYVFRHLPHPRIHPHAQLAAEAAEAAAAQGKFWEMHDWLFTHQNDLHREGLIAGAGAIGLDVARFTGDLDTHRFGDRVREDVDSAARSGARATPTFYVEDRRYDGPWDAESVLEAIRKPLGWRLRFLAQQFAGLSISSGLLMLLAVLLALGWANSPWGDSYHRLWATVAGTRMGGLNLALPLREWVNDGLIVIFFLVVALEIRQEITAGELRTARRAALPIAAALLGMLFPGLIYLLFNHGDPAAHGWGVPIGTDTALALGIMAILGSRVPLAVARVRRRGGGGGRRRFAPGHRGVLYRACRDRPAPHCPRAVAAGAWPQPRAGVPDAALRRDWGAPLAGGAGLRRPPDAGGRADGVRDPQPPATQYRHPAGTVAVPAS